MEEIKPFSSIIAPHLLEALDLLNEIGSLTCQRRQKSSLCISQEPLGPHASDTHPKVAHCDPKTESER